MTPIEIKAKIDRIASLTGNKVSSICQRVLKNPDYYDRLNKRIADDKVKSRQFSDYLDQINERDRSEKQQEPTQ
jgi:hypothetical protein